MYDATSQRTFACSGLAGTVPATPVYGRWNGAAWAGASGMVNDYCWGNGCMCPDARAAS
ncbi:MAG TPA: hypothetical protein VFZ65_22165 [Planctomycetota bacterium]|nr:hypothetical protein [Planctomycetota bacterium]